MGLSVESAIAAICLENRNLRNEAAVYTQLPSLKRSKPLIMLRNSQISARSTGHI
jgi:hypothetical protein